MKNFFLIKSIYLFSLFILFPLYSCPNPESNINGDQLSEIPEKTQEEKNREEFFMQWEREMNDYEPDFVYMIPLDYKASDVFYQKLINVPDNFKLRGAVLVDEDKNQNIDFRIESPSGNILYKNTSAQFIFNIEIKEKGIYKFYFDNIYENTEVRITFTLNSGNNNVLKKADLDSSEQAAKNILNFIEIFNTERKIKKNSQHNRKLSKLILIRFK